MSPIIGGGKANTINSAISIFTAFSTGNVLGGVSQGIGLISGAFSSLNDMMERGAQSAREYASSISLGRQTASDYLVSSPGAEGQTIRSQRAQVRSEIRSIVDSIDLQGEGQGSLKDRLSAFITMANFRQEQTDALNAGDSKLGGQLIARSEKYGRQNLENAGDIASRMFDLQMDLLDAYGDMDWSSIIREVYDLSQGIKNVGEASRITRLQMDAEEIRLRSELSQDFKRAGGDVFMQQEAYSRFQTGLTALNASSALAQSRGSGYSSEGSSANGSPSPSGKMAVGGGGGGNVTVQPTIVPITDVIKIDPSSQMVIDLGRYISIDSIALQASIATAVQEALDDRQIVT